MAITEVFDQVLEPVARTLGHRPEDLGIGAGTATITKIIEVVEDAVAKGWWKAFLYGVGGASTLYLSGQTRDPRTKLEGAIIGSNLIADLVEELAKNKEEAERTFSAFMEAIARGDIESALDTMVKTDAIEGLVAMAAGQTATGTAPKVEVVEVETLPSQPLEVTEAIPAVSEVGRAQAIV